MSCLALNVKLVDITTVSHLCHWLQLATNYHSAEVFFGSWLCLCTRQFCDMLLNLILVVFGNVCHKITVILFRFISNICLGQFFISAEHFAFLSFLYTFLLSFHSFSEFSVLSVTLCLYTELVEMLSLQVINDSESACATSNSFKWDLLNSVSNCACPSLCHVLFLLIPACLSYTPLSSATLSGFCGCSSASWQP